MEGIQGEEGTFHEEALPIPPSWDEDANSKEKESNLGGVFVVVMPGGGPTPGGGVWFVGCEAELVEGDGVRYSRSSSSRVTALEPGGRDGEPLACETWKYNKFHKGIPQDVP